MMRKILNSTLFVAGLAATILFTNCKKDKNGIFSESGNNIVSGAFGSSRLISGLGNIKYKSNLQMLEFESVEQFKAALSKIETDAKNFQYDKGNTQMLLNALNGCNVNNFNDDDIEEDDDDPTDLPQ
ncbi:MAG: hypothetical protein ABIP51_20915, partial [Bacteroidia bacterium]